ncbi:hypothetical protein MANES_14G063100v8 [Manihot esculenta]|uniref:Secreted protein n=1 Tax=Manihot esculenta TaxID=3983 RepID=A0A2C9UKD5_MANES|nr:hypothetical protein MANES_14G063100v8 [Manihot esculenta]
MSCLHVCFLFLLFSQMYRSNSKPSIFLLGGVLYVLNECIPSGPPYTDVCNILKSSLEICSK